MSSITGMALANEQGFQNRVEWFLSKAAIAVMAELLNTAGHAERVIYAGSVLDGTASVLQASIAVSTNATVDAAGLAVTDSDLEFTVNSMFSALAGFESGAAS